WCVYPLLSLVFNRLAPLITMGRMPCAALSAGARDSLMACSDLADNGPLPYTPTCTRYEQMPCPCLPNAYPSPARQRSMRRSCREWKQARAAAWRREAQGFEGVANGIKSAEEPEDFDLVCAVPPGRPPGGCATIVGVVAQGSALCCSSSGATKTGGRM